MLLIGATTALLMGLISIGFFVQRRAQVADTTPRETVPREFVVSRYRPMLRLLDESDCRFVAANLRGKSLRRFRAERRCLFRAYLRELDADHGHLVRALRELLVESNKDRPELARTLYRAEFMFRLAMISVEWQLAAHAMGIGAVDARFLLAALDCLQIQFQDLLFVQAVATGV